MRRLAEITCRFGSVEDDATPDTPACDKGGAHLEWRAVRGEEFPVAGVALGPPAGGFTEVYRTVISSAPAVSGWDWSTVRSVVSPSTV